MILKKFIYRLFFQNKVMANTSCVAAIYQGGGATLLCLSGTDDGGISGTDDGGVVVWISDMVWSVAKLNM
jgi:hypothetical protein